MTDLLALGLISNAPNISFNPTTLTLPNLPQQLHNYSL